MDDYNIRVEKLKELIDEADYILIGAGAGLSTAAGVEYVGKKIYRQLPRIYWKIRI